MHHDMTFTSPGQAVTLALACHHDPLFQAWGQQWLHRLSTPGEAGKAATEATSMAASLARNGNGRLAVAALLGAAAAEAAQAEDSDVPDWTANVLDWANDLARQLAVLGHALP